MFSHLNGIVKLKVKYKVNIFLLTNMLRKVKFGLNLGSDIIISKKENKENTTHEIDAQIKCSLCEEYNHTDLIYYSNCKLKGVKFEKIGRYKCCDNPICLNCIKRCEEVKVGSEVMFKYKVRKPYSSRRSFYTICKRGTVDYIGSHGNIIVIAENYEYNLKEENIMYKLNTCPWCRSHLLNHWTYNKEKYPKTKKKITNPSF